MRPRPRADPSLKGRPCGGRVIHPTAHGTNMASRGPPAPSPRGAAELNGNSGGDVRPAARSGGRTSGPTSDAGSDDASGSVWSASPPQPWTSEASDEDELWDFHESPDTDGAEGACPDFHGEEKAPTAEPLWIIDEDPPYVPAWWTPQTRDTPTVNCDVTGTNVSDSEK